MPPAVLRLRERSGRSRYRERVTVRMELFGPGFRHVIDWRYGPEVITKPMRNG
jgi:hypothetical protein